MSGVSICALGGSGKLSLQISEVSAMFLVVEGNMFKKALCVTIFPMNQSI